MPKFILSTTMAISVKVYAIGKIKNVFLKPTEYSKGLCENGVGRVKLKLLRCVKKANTTADADRTAASTKQLLMLNTIIKGRAKIRFSTILMLRYCVSPKTICKNSVLCFSPNPNKALKALSINRYFARLVL